MKKLIERMLTDLSTREVFRFRIACASCGMEFGGRQMPFSKAGLCPPTQGKRILFETLYEQEFRDARNAAVREAAEHLNYCPVCKRLICNRCFLICDDLDMCRQCAARLEETGSPVLNDVWEAAI